MTSTDALLAVLLGNLILALMGLALGMIGCREGRVSGMYFEGSVSIVHQYIGLQYILSRDCRVSFSADSQRQWPLLPLPTLHFFRVHLTSSAISGIPCLPGFV